MAAWGYGELWREAGLAARVKPGDVDRQKQDSGAYPNNRPSCETKAEWFGISGFLYKPNKDIEEPNGQQAHRY